MADQRLLSVLFVGILWGCVLGIQRPAPRYSQQLMPDTSFTCRHKIVGSYYADPETDCQLFHVCVSVAGSIQDYRFLCPNDTAFDQESQTCADWYDVDCEAATLYYASDNFDLYRLGSGLESLHYDSVRNDVEPQDHLQRSESSDPVRSSVNNLNRVAASTNNNNDNNNRDILRGSSSSNFFNNRNNGKEEDYDNEKVYREESAVESRRQHHQGVRKVARKQQYSNNNNNNILPTTSSPQNFENQNRNNNYQNNGNNVNLQRQTSGNFATPTTARPFVDQENNFGRNNQNGNVKYNTPPSTYRPTTVNSYQENNNGFNSNQQSNFNNFNSNKFSGNQQNYPSTTFAQSSAAVSSTSRPTDYTQNVSNKKKTTEQSGGQTFTNQYNTQYNQYSTQSTTPRASTSFQTTDYTAYQQKNYNNIQRSTKPAATDFPTTTTAPNYYDDYAIAARLNDPQNINKVSTTRQQEISKTTPRFTNNFAGSSYIPTTYSPVTKKVASNGNGNSNNQGQVTNRGNDQYTGQYEASRTTNSGQYREKTTAQQTSQTYKNTQAYDTVRPNFNNNDNNGQYRDVATKLPKKATQYNNYETKLNSDGTTKSFDNFDQGRAASVTGFSPASVNKLAESPVTLRPTTPVARRTVYNVPTTQRPSSSATNYEPQTTPSSRTGSFVSATPRPFASTSRSVEQQTPTTIKPKTSKKNDYDYAYYDNAGTLEYDDLEQVTGSRDTAKISRN